MGVVVTAPRSRLGRVTRRRGGGATWGAER
jgi:hypothetical protein